MPDKSDDQETVFICAALATRLFPEKPFPDPPAGLDWERLYTLLIQHRLAAHFYVLGSSNRNNWPDTFRNRLRLERYSLILYGDQCIHRLRPVLSALTDADIPVIVLKGWALIQTIYEGDYGQRSYDDIDILVAPKDADASESILKKLGWAGLEERRPGYLRHYFNVQAYLYYEQPKILGRVFSVGFHWGLLHHPVYNPEQIDVESLFTRAHKLEIAGVPVLEMSVEDHFVYSCAHIVLQHRSEEILIRYYEIALAIQATNPALNWGKVMELAGQWKLVLPVKKVARRIEELWPGVIPTFARTAIENLKPALGERFIHMWYKKNNHNLSSEHFLTWLTMTGIKRRFSFILEDIFPNPGYMMKYFGPAPGGLWPLLYFRRYFQGIWKLFGP